MTALSSAPCSAAVLRHLLEEPLTCRELCERIYADREDGGPEWALTVIKVQIHKLRRRGVPINGGRGRRSVPYEIPQESREMVKRLLGDVPEQG